MTRFVNEMLILALCLPLVAWHFQGWASTISILIAIIATLVFELASYAQVRMSIAAALIVACVTIPAAAPFMPLAAYLATTQRYWTVRFLWPIGCCVIFVRAPLYFSIVILLECCIAAVLAIQTCRLTEHMNALRESRDSVKESLVMLLDRDTGQGETFPASEDNAQNATGNKDVGAEVPIPTAPDTDCTPPSPTAVSTLAANISAANQVTDNARLLRFSDLSERENTVVSLIAEGCENKEIAARLYLSEGTVRNVVSSILQKKQLSNRTQIAVMYYRG